MSMQEAFKQARVTKTPRDKRFVSLHDRIEGIGQDWHTVRLVGLSEDSIDSLRQRWALAQSGLIGIDGSERYLDLTVLGRGLHVWSSEDSNFPGVKIIKEKLPEFLPGSILNRFAMGRLTTGAQVYAGAIVDLTLPQRDDFATLFGEIFKGRSDSTIRLDHVVWAVDKWLFPK